MKRFVIDPAQFDGAKFAERYGLDAMRGDFWARQEGAELALYTPDTVPDLPVFEAPTKPRIEVLRSKRRRGEALTAAERDELLDLLLGV